LFPVSDDGILKNIGYLNLSIEEKISWDSRMAWKHGHIRFRTDQMSVIPKEWKSFQQAVLYY
jgi:hypothetical protein